MSIVAAADIYIFLGITDDNEENYFTITAGNDTIVLTYTGGSATNVSVADGTYTGAELAAALETAIDTAFTITSTVSYSSTTRKFTITAPTEKTFVYTHSGSDMGLTIGFTGNKAAALTLTSDIAAGSPTEIVDVIHDSVEDFVTSYCRRTFDSTSYTREKYNSTGGRYLSLDNYPITAIARITIGVSTAIRIKNTSIYTKASVSVSSTVLTLSKDGSDSTLAFETYTTMTLLVAAVNALGSGWSASVADSAYASFASTELIEKYGLSCIDSNEVDLKIPYEDAEYDFDVLPDEGTIIFNRNIPQGSQNVFVDYTAGYSSTTMPDDLKLAVKILTKSLYQRLNEETFGAEDFSLGDSSAKMEKVMPSEVRAIINRYKRRLV